jgi:hypothetical protein
MQKNQHPQPDGDNLSAGSEQADFQEGYLSSNSLIIESDDDEESLRKQAITSDKIPFFSKPEN